MDVIGFIEKKRDGGAHAPGELEAFVRAFALGKVPEYPVAAWLKAV